MNAQLRDVLGSFAPSDNSVNSWTSNSLGDVVFITKAGELQHINIRATIDFSPRQLEIDEISPDEIKEFTHIEFDQAGSMLLLWSKQNVIVVELPASYLNSSENSMDRSSLSKKCICRKLLEDEMDVEMSAISIVKATFHNLNSRHVVILREKRVMYVVDIFSLDVQYINLSIEHKFTSFTFGGCLEWLKYSLFLLTRKGEVFIICPVIPAGTAISKKDLNNMWTWLDIQEAESSDNNGRGGGSGIDTSYIAAVRAYMTDWLGPSIHFLQRGGAGDEEDSDSANVREQYIWAGSNHQGDSLDDEERGGPPRNGQQHQLNFANYSPMLQGPLSVQRGASEADPSNGLTPVKRDAVDICSPGGYSSNSSSSSHGGCVGAPVLAVSYSSGEVELFVIDPEAAVTAFLGPCWRPIDRTLSNITYPTPSLLLVEIISVNTAGGDVGVGAAVLQQMPQVRHSMWKLTADSVVAHYIHVTCFDRFESYLISCSWLRDALRNSAKYNSYGRHHGSDDDGEFDEVNYHQHHSQEKKDCDPHYNQQQSLEFQPSICMQTLAASSSSSSSDDGGSSSSDSSNAAIKGMIVTLDPFIGHVVLVRCNTGAVFSINVTVCTKICELQQKMHSRHARPDQHKLLKGELAGALGDEELRWKQSQKLLLIIAAGIKKMQQSVLDPNITADSSAFLVESAQSIEKSVIIPMNELAQNTKFHFELLQFKIEAQMEFLCGGNRNGVDDSTGGNGGSGGGIQATIEKLVREHDLLVERVKKIQEKFEMQQETSAQLVTLSLSLKPKITRAEKIYKEQLEVWSKTIAKHAEQIENLRSLVHPAVSSPLMFGAAATACITSREQQPSGGAGAGAEAGAAVVAPSPGSMVKKGGGGFRAPPKYSIFSPQKQSLASVGGESGGPGSASSTMSAYQRLFPTGSGARGQPQQRRTPSSTGQSNLFGSPLAANQSGANTPGSANRASTVATPASATSSRPLLHATPGSSYSPNPSQRQQQQHYHQQQRGASSNNAAATTTTTTTTAAPAPAVTLSSEDMAACEQLLSTQQEMLSGSKKELLHLEAKLKILKQRTIENMN